MFLAFSFFAISSDTHTALVQFSLRPSKVIIRGTAVYGYYGGGAQVVRQFCEYGIRVSFGRSGTLKLICQNRDPRRKSSSKPRHCLGWLIITPHIGPGPKLEFGFGFGSGLRFGRADVQGAGSNCRATHRFETSKSFRGRSSSGSMVMPTREWAHPQNRTASDFVAFCRV